MEITTFEEWRAEYPDGTRILWYEQYLEKKWLPGVITGQRSTYGHPVLLFTLKGDGIRSAHQLSFENRKLLKKE